jgi:hypothetical protein
MKSARRSEIHECLTALDEQREAVRTVAVLLEMGADATRHGVDVRALEGTGSLIIRELRGMEKTLAQLRKALAVRK